MARELAAAESAAVYGRIGTTTQEFGTLASWLVDVLNVLTGQPRPAGRRDVPARRRGAAQLRRRAGPRPRAHPRPLALARARPAGEPRRAAGRRARRGDGGAGRGPGAGADHARRQPGALDAELGADRARAGRARPLRRGRHLRQRDDAPRRRRAARAVAAAALALRPRALPARGPQRGELLAAGAAARARHARTSGRRCCGWPASPPGQGVLDDVEPLDRLVAGELLRRELASPHSPLHGRDVDELLAEVAPRRGPERLLDLLLRAGPYDLTLADLEAAPHGIDLGPLEPRLPDVLRTPSGRIELAPAPIAGDVARLRDALDRAARGRRAGARRPPPAALQQLVDAQPRAARLRARALHAAGAPRRRRAARARGRRARAGGEPRRGAGGAGRGHRRRDAGRRLAPARLGPRRAAARGSASPARTPASTRTCWPTRGSSTRSPATRS